MDSNTVIQIKGLSKIYKLYNAPVDRLKETFHPFNKKYHKDFYALRNVNLSMSKGEVVGIVGKNGAGKSTLLQIITGVLSPSSGSVEVRGKISALLELGGGFNPELTGLENIYFKSSLMGYSREETEEKIDEILSFADIGEFVYQPVKTYSSGMFVRLAFAVAINVNPEILIIDEALSVGDFRFKQKCLRKINQFREENKTILFVSHDQGSVIKFCTRAVWLRDGEIVESGLPGDVCKHYTAYMSSGEYQEVKNEGEKTPRAISSNKKEEIVGKYDHFEWVDVPESSSFGAGGAQIQKVCLSYKKNNKKIEIFQGGERVIFAVKIHVKRDIVHPIVGFHVSDVKGVNVLGMNSITLGVDLGEFKEGDEKVIEFEFDFPRLKLGNYSFSPAVAEGTQVDNMQHHWVHDAYIVRIASTHEAASLGHYLVITENVDVRKN